MKCGDAARRVRQVRVLGAEAEFDRRSDGTIYVRSPRALGSYPARWTDRLEQWAVDAPNRDFLVQREAGGEWRRLSYSAAFQRVRCVAEALIRRGLGSHSMVNSRPAYTGTALPCG